MDNSDINAFMRRMRLNSGNPEFAAVVQEMNIQAAAKNKANTSKILYFNLAKLNDNHEPTEEITLEEIPEIVGSIMENQRDKLFDLKGSLIYFSEKIKYTMEKADRYEKTALGEFSQDDLNQITFNKEKINGRYDWELKAKKDAAQIAASLKKELRDTIRQIPDITKMHLQMGNEYAKMCDTMYGDKVSMAANEQLMCITGSLSVDNLGLSELDEKSIEDVLILMRNAVAVLSGMKKNIEKQYMVYCRKEISEGAVEKDASYYRKYIEENDNQSKTNYFDTVSENKSFLNNNKGIHIDVSALDVPIQSAVKFLDRKA